MRGLFGRYARRMFWKRKPPPAFELSVLMVCMGNICRSPTAEAVLRSKLQRAGLGERVRVDSAGTHCDKGSPCDPRAVAAGAKRGHDLSRTRTRRVDPAELQHFDLVLVMDEQNLANLQSACPEELRDRVKLLLDAAPNANGVREVPDPYYGAPAGFDRVLDLIEPACEALVGQLRERLATVR